MFPSNQRDFHVLLSLPPPPVLSAGLHLARCDCEAAVEVDCMVFFLTNVWGYSVTQQLQHTCVCVNSTCEWIPVNHQCVNSRLCSGILFVFFLSHILLHCRSILVSPVHPLIFPSCSVSFIRPRPASSPARSPPSSSALSALHPHPSLPLLLLLPWCSITPSSPSTTPSRQRDACRPGRLPNHLPPSLLHPRTPLPPSLPPCWCYKYPASVSHRRDVSVASPTASHTPPPPPPPPYTLLSSELISRPHTFFGTHLHFGLRITAAQLGFKPAASARCGAATSYQAWSQRSAWHLPTRKKNKSSRRGGAVNPIH